MMTDKILLAGVLIFLAAMAYNGSKKGVIRLVYSVVAMVVAMMLSQCLAIPVSNFLTKSTPVYKTIKSHTENYVETNIRPNIELKQLEGAGSVEDALELPEALKNMLFDESVLGKDAEELLSGDIVTIGTDKICESISKGLAAVCMRAVVSIVIFIIIAIALSFISKTLNIFSRIPGIYTLNKTAGAIVGLAEGIVVLWIVSIVIMTMSGTATGNALMTMIDKNSVLSFIYDTNIFAKLFQNTLDVSAIS